MVPGAFPKIVREGDVASLEKINPLPRGWTLRNNTESIPSQPWLVRTQHPAAS